MSFNLIIPTFLTSSGQVYLAEEENSQQQTKTKYFALQPTSQFSPSELMDEKGLRHKCFRQYIKFLNQENNSYYVFSFTQGSTIAQKIRENRSKKCFSINELNYYLIQLLNALYLLHSNGILGRVFSTENIIDCEDGILLMDFGFAPNINSSKCENSPKCEIEIDILTSPEVITSLLSAEQMARYNMKLDSWLLGAFLYHLGKLDPINTKQEQLKNYFFKFNQKGLFEYDLHLKAKSQQLPHIKFQTNRYSEQFCNFVESLLKYDPEQRLSFSQIYESEYIRSLKIQNAQQIINFYVKLERNFKDSIIQKNITIREQYSVSQILVTGNLVQNPVPLQQQLIQQQQEENKNKYLNSLGLLSQVKSNVSNNNKNKDELLITTPTTQFDIKDFKDVKTLYPYYYEDFYDSRYKLIWLHIYMEEFKFIFLNETAKDVVECLEKKNFGAEQVVAYNLKKMSILILKEFLSKLKKNSNPWNSIEDNLWGQFCKDQQKITLETALVFAIENVQKEANQKFLNHCEKYITDDRLEKNIRDDLLKDKESNFAFNQSSQEFLNGSYRQSTKLLFNYLRRIENQFQNDQKGQWRKLQLQILLSHLINRIFDMNKINTQFKYIRAQNKEYLSPNEIYLFLASANNDDCKQEEIAHLIDKYIQKQQQ